MSRTAIFCLFALLTGCSDPPQVQGVVNDIWNSPITEATVIMEGAAEPVKTDEQGQFAFLAQDTPMSFSVGKEGYISNSAQLTPPADDAEMPSVDFALYPKPDSDGFHLIAQNEYRHLEAARVSEIGTELRSYTGIADIGQVAIRTDEKLSFIFQSTLRASQLTQLQLQVHRLEFTETVMVPGVEGDTPVGINRWIAVEPVEFDVKGLNAENLYMINLRTKVPEGVYAFHVENLLTNNTPGSLSSTPQEMQVAYPFEVK